ncbi:UNKNOWN [Stylonychia lemnae]|uniref:Short chain dehydrogenase reductase family protein n=1 Tax=Stylonychia lemnae TaxID=5949 RepID=A0A078AUS0_STYLE|nr:UNKNOWN [Stylonychia lemnae]|eukprot:CDW84987.1 UNKNOWN [Stylonychia lemnae]
MEKFNQVISSLKNFDLKSIANDKVVVCLAVIGLATSTRYVANRILELKNKPKSSKTSQLKQIYDGEWALVLDFSEENGLQLALNLAKEGYNIMTFVRNSYDHHEIFKHIEETYKVNTKAVVYDIRNLSDVAFYEDFSKTLNSIEDDFSVIVSNLRTLAANRENDAIEGQDGEGKSFQNVLDQVKQNIAQQLFLYKVLQPRLLKRYDSANKKGAIINIQFLDAAKSDPYTAAYASQKAYEYTVGIGLGEEQEQGLDKVDILSALQVESDIVITKEGEKSEVIKELSDETGKQQNEELQKLQMDIREYEFVPQHLYNQHILNNKQKQQSESFGVWPFRREIQQLPQNKK